MNEPSDRADAGSLRAAIAALEAQRPTLGEAVATAAMAPLRQQLAALEAGAGLRRRQVTVMFADIVGTDPLAQELALERLQAAVDALRSRAADRVQAQGGRVLRFAGDGLKAAFGADGTREDDAERAVRAGLEIVALEMAVDGAAPLSMRVGLHTGMVALGTGIEADDTAIGPAVHLAARLQQSTDAGTADDQRKR